MPMAMVCWLPVVMEWPVEASRVLLLALSVEPMEMEQPLAEEALEKLGHRVTRERVNHSVDKSVRVPPGVCYSVYRP